MKEGCIYWLLLMAMSLINPSFGQKQADSSLINVRPPVPTMKQEYTDVVVTGQQIPTLQKNAIYNVTTISQAELASKGATNLREALDNRLGINLTQDNIFGSSAGINGISGEGIKILVNGAPLVGRIDGKLDLSQINMNNVERIEIVKGPLSVLYGSDAMGGVINIITKNQKDNWNVYAKGFYESVGQYNVGIGVGVNYKKIFFTADAGRNFFDGFSVKDTSRHKDWRPKEQYFANAKLGFAINHFKLWSEVSFFRELMIDRGDLRPYTSYAFDQHFKTYRPMTTIGFSITGKSNLLIDGTIAYSGFYRIINNYKKDLVSLSESLRANEEQDTTTYHNLNIRPVLLKKFDKQNLQLQAGLDINQLWTKQQRIIGRDKQMGDYAVFASLLYSGIKGFNIQAGGRLLYNSQFGFAVMPSANAKLNIGKYVLLRGSYGMGYRTPSLKELYLDFKDSNHDINGNANLRPENSHNVSLSLDYNEELGNHVISFSNSFSYNNVFNKIDLAIENTNTIPVAYQYFNLKNYTTVSGQHELTYRYKRFYVGAGLIYIQTKVKVNTSSNEVKLWSTDVTAKIGYKIPKAEINVDVWYKYNGKKLLYMLNNSIETGTIGAFHSLNISASKAFWKKRILLTIGGKNLLNVTNVQTQGVSVIGHNTDPNNSQVNWGRTFFAGLTFQLSK